MVELERQAVELFERSIVVGVLPRPVQPCLDRVAVTLGEMLEYVALLVLNAALDGDVVAEDLPDGLPEALRPVDHEQHPLLDVEPAVDEVGEQRRGDGRVLGRCWCGRAARSRQA